MQENTSSIIDRGEKCVRGGGDGGSIGVVRVEERGDFAKKKKIRVLKRKTERRKGRS